MSEPTGKTYRIETIEDIANIPPDRREAFWPEFAMAFKIKDDAHRLGVAAMRALIGEHGDPTGEGQKILDEESMFKFGAMDWTDDGIQGCTGITIGHKES